MRMQRALVEAAVMQAASRSRALHAAAEMRPARTRMMTSRLGRCSESRMLCVVADRGEPRLRLLRVVYVYCMLCTHSSGYLTRCRAECISGTLRGRSLRAVAFRVELHLPIPRVTRLHGLISRVHQLSPEVARYCAGMHAGIAMQP